MHSLALLSDDEGMPGGSEAEKSARQQYRPASVIVIVSETTVPFVVNDFEPAATPPELQRVVESAANGPQRWNWTVPVKEATPLTVTAALSVTAIVALAGIGVGKPIDGVVTVDEVHSPIWPWAKSNSVAVGDCEERVSPMKTLKQCPPRFDFVRFSPPSKNCAVGRV